MRTEVVGVPSAVRPVTVSLARGWRIALAVAVMLAIAAAAVVFVAWRIDERGQAFFATGEAIVRQLEGFARQVALRDAAPLRAFLWCCSDLRSAVLRLA